MHSTLTSGNRLRPYHLQGRNRPQSQGTNVSDLERWLSLAGGGVLVAAGLRRGSLGGLALAAVGGCLVYRGATGHCSLYQALGVNTSEQPHGPASVIPAGHGVRVEHSTTINRPPEELYRFWRNLENLPRFMKHLRSVQSRGGNRSHWVAQGPGGVSVEWDAEIITERPNELIGWRSLPGSEVETAGSVHFQRGLGTQQTVVRVNLKYDPPGGKAGAAIAKLFGQEPEQQIRSDLQEFKQMMEAGKVTA